MELMTNLDIKHRLWKVMEASELYIQKMAVAEKGIKKINSLDYRKCVAL